MYALGRTQTKLFYANKHSLTPKPFNLCFFLFIVAFCTTSGKIVFRSRDERGEKLCLIVSAHMLARYMSSDRHIVIYMDPQI